MKAILGIKKGMTRVFKDDKVVPVTVIDTSGCILSYLESKGFELGLGEEKNPIKSMKGKYAVAKKVPQKRTYFKGELDGELKIGDEIKSDQFVAGDKVVLSGVSKGKGFAGVVKRYRFKGGPKTHGQSDRLRAPGSIGAGTDPGRILKGKRMAGRMGQEKITLLGREIVDIKYNLLLIKGPVPGSNGDLIAIFTK
ncbi:MAG TPA: 50S ribosomal protein L3 [Candidatus Dojkabacteria bacterium]|nr:50S ribosomal protein L3 [Candidatus Dojkabacteria bacterium]